MKFAKRARTSFARLVAWSGCVLVLAACGGSTPGDRAESTMTKFRAENTKEKLFARGKMFAAVGDNTRAEQYFAAALEAGADEVKVFPLLLAACLNDSRFRLAAQYTEDYLKHHPEDVRARLVLGTVYVALGDNGPAENELRRVMAAAPSDPHAHYALGALLHDAKGEYVEADKQFREYLRLAPHGPFAAQARDGLLPSEP